jgi:hypothetical protein
MPTTPPRRPKSLVSGVVFYYDETEPAVPWVAGLGDVLELAKRRHVTTQEIRNVAEDTSELAYLALIRSGALIADEQTYKEWVPTVLALFPDETERGASDIATELYAELLRNEQTDTAEALRIFAISHGLGGLVAELDVETTEAEAGEASAPASS